MCRYDERLRTLKERVCVKNDAGEMKEELSQKARRAWAEVLDDVRPRLLRTAAGLLRKSTNNPDVENLVHDSLARQIAGGIDECRYDVIRYLVEGIRQQWNTVKTNKRRRAPESIKSKAGRKLAEILQRLESGTVTKSNLEACTRAIRFLTKADRQISHELFLEGRTRSELAWSLVGDGRRRIDAAVERFQRELSDIVELDLTIKDAKKRANAVHRRNDDDGNPELLTDVRSSGSDRDLEFILHLLPSERDREILRLKHVWGMTYAEIAEKLSVSRAEARRRYNKARDRLRRAIEKSSQPLEILRPALRHHPV